MPKEDFLVDFIRNSNITYVSNGAFGIGFLVNLNNTQIMGTEPFPYTQLTLDNPNPENKGKVDSIFIKLQILTNNEDLTYHKIDLGPVALTPAMIGEFVQECKYQINIFKRSNYNLSPICPPIFDCLQLNHDSKIFKFLYDRCPERKYKFFFDELQETIEKNTFFSLGVIVMPVLQGETLKAYKKQVPIVKQIDADVQTIAKLVKLYDIGYMHNDLHQGNVLVNPSEKVTATRTGKAYLIDFGHTTRRRTIARTETLRLEDKLNEIVKTRHPIHNEGIETWHSYQWVNELIGDTKYFDKNGKQVGNDIVAKVSINDTPDKKKRKEDFISWIKDILESMNKYEENEIRKNRECKKREPSNNEPSNNQPSNNQPSNNEPSNNQPSNNKKPRTFGGVFSLVLENIRNIFTYDTDEYSEDEYNGGAVTDVQKPSFLQRVSSFTKKMKPTLAKSRNKSMDKSRNKSMDKSKSKSTGTMKSRSASKQTNPPLSKYKDYSIVTEIGNNYIAAIKRGIDSLKEIEENYKKSQKSK